jgi:hypothetical protein
VVLTAGLLTYALLYSVVASPILPMRFRHTQIEAAHLTALVQAAPAPIYRAGDTALNVLPYVPGRILTASFEELQTLPAPAWMVQPNAEAVALLARRPDKLHVVMPLGDQEEWRLLRLDERRQASPKPRARQRTSSTNSRRMLLPTPILVAVGLRS